MSLIVTGNRTANMNTSGLTTVSSFTGGNDDGYANFTFGDVFNFFGTNYGSGGSGMYWNANSVLGFGVGVQGVSTKSWAANTGAGVLLGNADREAVSINYSTTSSSITEPFGSVKYMRMVVIGKQSVAGPQNVEMEIRFFRVTSSSSPTYYQYIEVSLNKVAQSPSAPGNYNITDGSTFQNTFTGYTPAASTSFVLASDDLGNTWTLHNNSYVGMTSITWSNPSDITFGTALSSTQLNATVNNVGTSVYNPLSGTVLGAGNSQTLNVSFTPSDTNNYNNANANVTINVLKGTPSISWSNPSDITFGTTLSGTQLNATASFGGSPSPGTFVYNPVSGSLLGAGNAQTLSTTFNPTDSSNLNNANANVTINVSKGTPSISWSNPSNITFGTLLSGTQLNATATFGGSPSPGTFVYNPVSGTKLGAGSGQTLSTTFSPTDSSNLNNANANVLINVDKGTPSITWSNPSDITYGTALSGTQLNATASFGGSSTPGTFVYSPVSGSILNAGNGQVLSTTFTPTDLSNLNNANANVTINVLKANPPLIWSTPANIVYGTALSSTQLNASSSIAGTFTYPSNPVGTILPKGNNQTLYTTFTSSNANYNNSNTSVLINVTGAIPSITWGSIADIYVGTALSSTQLNATANVAGSFSYTPPVGTLLNAGNGQVLSTTFTPTDTTNYEIVTTTNTINVLKSDNYLLEWNTIENIQFLTPLTFKQLNATSNISGTFIYEPIEGTILSPGTHTLTVTFTPFDTTDYDSKSTTNTITVIETNSIQELDKKCVPDVYYEAVYERNYKKMENLFKRTQPLTRKLIAFYYNQLRVTSNLHAQNKDSSAYTLPWMSAYKGSTGVNVTLTPLQQRLLYNRITNIRNSSDMGFVIFSLGNYLTQLRTAQRYLNQKLDASGFYYLGINIKNNQQLQNYLRKWIY